MVCLRMVRKRLFDGVLQIGHESAFVTSGEVVCHYRIKTRATRTDKEPVVRQTVVHGDRFAVVEHFDGFVRPDRDIQMSSKPVSAAHGENTQSRFSCALHFVSCAFNDSLGYFVHGSITTDRHNGVKAHPCKLVCQFRGMTGVFREHNIRKPPVHVQCLHDYFRQFLFCVLCLFRPGHGVDDKCNIFHVVNPCLSMCTYLCNLNRLQRYEKKSTCASF